MEPLLRASRGKLFAALDIFLASVSDYPGFDPGRDYAPKEREPLDALSDRYLRAFESALRFFRTWERLREAAPSETFRDLLLRMEKVGLISSAQAWLTMRDVRNRIAHEYLPEELAKIYAAMVEQGGDEFRRLHEKVAGLE
jgi:hypothetical protein